LDALTIAHAHGWETRVKKGAGHAALALHWHAQLLRVS
jgi:hypothetical protein